MWDRARRVLALLVSVTFVAGCTVPGAQQQGATVQYVELAGTPWKAWSVRGAMTADDQVRLEDDYFAAINRDGILWRNEHPDGSASVTQDRENQIDDQMAELLASDSKGSAQTAHDLDSLRALYDLYQNWDERDADGCEPVRPIVNRLRAIKTIDEYTEWLCSDDFRLTRQWCAPVLEEAEITNVTLFSLSLYNNVDDDGEAAGGYVVEVVDPMMGLAPFEWDDADVLVGGKVDEDGLQMLRNASTSVDIAYNMLEHMGFSEDEAADIVCEAAVLESVMAEGIGDEADGYALLSHDELVATCKGGFPLDRIVDAYGYSDAAEYVVDDMVLLKHMGTVYSQDNLEYLVSHALTSLAIQSSVLLDSEAMSIAYYADGDAYITDELLEAVQEQEELEQDASAEQVMSEEEYALNVRRSGCEYLREALPTSFAKLYVENFYDPSISTEVEDLVKRYVEKYEKMLLEEDWLSQETRQKAVEKLRAMRIQVGYPSEWASTDTLSIGSHDEGGSLFTQTRSLAAYDLEQELDMLRHPEKGEYWRDCMDVNAYYFVGTNSVAIGAGILGGDFWPEKGTFEQRLGGMGMTIGHEISHAFDGSGAYFDKDGKYNSWWTEKDLTAFEERVDRVVQCFDQIDPLGEGPYDGRQVCDEAIADMGGMKVTMLLASEQKDFDYDAFFRAYAKGWEEVAFKEDLEYLLLADSHPLANHRVNVPVREVDEFNETYHITEQDGMWLAPHQRVSVW